MLAGRPTAVAIFVNKTSRANLEGALTRSLIAELAPSSRGGIVTEDAAELVLSGTVEDYHSDAVAYSASDKVRQYRATMTVEAQLTEKRSGQVLWKGRETASSDYPVSAPLPLQQNSEAVAVEDICRNTAQRLTRAFRHDF